MNPSLRKSSVLLTVLFLLASLPFHRASAQSIGINLTGDTEGGLLTSSETAGAPAYAQQFWNNVSVFLTPVGGITDNHGALTPVTAEARGFTFNSTGSYGTPDFKLMNTTIGAIGPGTGVVLRNVPYSLYDLIVYYNGTTPVGLTGDLFFRVPDFDSPEIASGRFTVPVGPAFTGTFGQGNYYRINSLSYPSIGVGTLSVNLAAIQIIPVPEAAPSALVSAGLLLIAIVRAKVKSEKR